MCPGLVGSGQPDSLESVQRYSSTRLSVPDPRDQCRRVVYSTRDGVDSAPSISIRSRHIILVGPMRMGPIDKLRPSTS
uniref:Uncharacterized protein n=1 Tax=Arundo donax TaxID=35708 RepID=A0A0A9HB79_ARUDO